MPYWTQMVKEWDILMNAKVLSMAIFLCGSAISYGFARWRYAKQIQLQKTQVDFHKEQFDRLKDESLRSRDDQSHVSPRAEGSIRLHSVRAQVAQVIDGTKLIEKWQIRLSDLLSMVKYRLIDAYAPDTEDIVNKTETDFERSMGFYSEDNETDEDTVTRFRFTPRDICRVEMIAESYQTTT